MIHIKAPGLKALIKYLQDREALIKGLPEEITSKDRLIVTGPKLWQADTDAEERKLAEMEKDNQFAVNVIKSKIEDPLRSMTP